MHFGTTEVLLNLLLFLLWFRLWSGADRGLVFNPYMAPISRAADFVLNFLRAVFLGRDDRIVLGGSMAAILILRAVIAPNDEPWILHVGLYSRQPVNNGFGPALAFSVLSFGFFLFTLWGLSLLYVYTRRQTEASQASETLYYFGRPFTDIAPSLRPAALLIYGLVLVTLVNLIGHPWSHPWAAVHSFSSPQTVAWPTRLILHLIATLACWVNVLSPIQFFVTLFIIGSWVSMFAESQSLMYGCREWLNLLLGPLRHYQVCIGPVDIVPWLAVFAIHFAHLGLIKTLEFCYGRLL